MNDYINSHPKESLRLVSIGLMLIYQSVALITGIILYILLARLLRYPKGIILVMGIIIIACAIYFQQDYLFFQHGFKLNIAFWKILLKDGLPQAVAFVCQNQLNHMIGCGLLLAGLLDLIDLIPTPIHQVEMEALQKGLHSQKESLSEKTIDAALKKLPEINDKGTVLGVSTYTGQAIIIPDKDINQVMLVLGTTGGGKTVTLRRFYHRAVIQGYPLIIVDGKPDVANITWLQQLAEKHTRLFIGFNCGNYLPYDPLAHGGYTELKDKIISLKDEWSSDYYKSIAEDYLQTTFAVLQKSNKPFDLQAVSDCLDHNNLVMRVREIEDSQLAKKVASLEHYDRKDVTGLQAHLNILIHSELGQFFEKNHTTFNLKDAIQQNAIVYFALPALRFPSFSKVLGKLVINDLKAVIDRDQNQKPIFTIFDEFSVFAGDQVLNLVNMGRGKGVHAIFGTQGLADLDKVDKTFKSQVLNCANTLICHRLNDQESAETIAAWIGTQDGFTVTAQINPNESNANLGSVRGNKEFIIHPDVIKQELKTGQAFHVTKVKNFKWEKVQIKF